jgi:opacity protein-like surface antigen
MEESMKKRMFLLGSSVLGLALTAGAAQAADDVQVEVAPAGTAVEATTTETTVTETKEEEKPQTRGFYVGGSVGGSFFSGPGLNSNIFNNDRDGTVEANEFNPTGIGNDSNFMWSAFAGYRMAEWLAAEVGWTDIGGFTASENVGTRSDKVDVEVDGVEVRLRAFIPLGMDRLSAVVGPGIFIFSSHGGKKCRGTDVSGCDNGQPGVFKRVPAALDPREDSGQALTAAAGLEFKATDNIVIRTEYQYFHEVLDQDVHTVTASVVYGFYDFFGQLGGGDSMGGVVIE